MAPGICFVLLLLGSSAPLASCVGKFIRKEAKTAVSYVLSPSGAISESPANGGTSEIKNGSESSLSDYGGSPVVGPVDAMFNTSECKADLQSALQCGAGGLCSDWGNSTLRNNTQRAYAAALLAGGADLADSLALSMFPLLQLLPLADERQTIDRTNCTRTPGCLDLRVDDPSGWCCECMVNMMATCAGVNQTCFRDNMCNHSQVSKVWKQENDCTTAQVDNGCAQCQEVQEPTIDLATAGGFALLTKTGATTTVGTSITGDMGVSPAAATYFTGFALDLDAGAEFSTSNSVNGTVYAASYAGTTPGMMTTAISDMEAAYTDAAGRNDPITTELGGGNIEGMSLAGGVHKWSTSVTFSTNLSFDAGANPDTVWIMQIEKNLTLGNGAQVTLLNGAKASNIFWQVAEEVHIPAGAHAEGIILCKTAIIFGSQGSLNGRALAQTAITLIANTIVAPQPQPPSSPAPSLTEDGNSASPLNIRASSLASKLEAEGNSLDETLEDKCSTQNR